MKKADEGRFLSRGGQKLEINKSEEAFTVQLPRSRAGTDNIQKTYTLVDTLALGAALGQSASGTWLLQVADRASRDVGKLNGWSLELAI
jgi:subtilisin-like proprotein convertase family protein